MFQNILRTQKTTGSGSGRGNVSLQALCAHNKLLWVINNEQPESKNKSIRHSIKSDTKHSPHNCLEQIYSQHASQRAREGWQRTQTEHHYALREKKHSYCVQQNHGPPTVCSQTAWCRMHTNITSTFILADSSLISLCFQSLVWERVSTFLCPFYMLVLTKLITVHLPNCMQLNQILTLW